MAVKGRNNGRSSPTGARSRAAAGHVGSWALLASLLVLAVAAAAGLWWRASPTPADPLADAAVANADARPLHAPPPAADLRKAGPAKGSGRAADRRRQLRQRGPPTYDDEVGAVETCVLGSGSPQPCPPSVVGGVGRQRPFYVLGGSPQLTRCADLAGRRTIYNLRCGTPRHATPYHRLVDCFLGNLDLFEAAAAAVAREPAGTVAVVVPRSLHDFVPIVLPEATARAAAAAVAVVAELGEASPGGKDAAAAPCVRVSRGTAVTYSSRDHWGTFFSLRQAAAHRLRHTLLAPYLAASGGADDGPPTVLFIERGRHEPRRLDNLDQVRAAVVAALPGWQVATYRGVESLAETVALFHRSRVVVGTHGAGLGNALFCRNDTVVVELTLAATPAMGVVGRVWRSNSVVGRYHNRQHWLVYGLPVTEEVLPSWPALRRLTGPALFQALEDVPAVRVPEAALPALAFDLQQALRLASDAAAAARVEPPTQPDGLPQGGTCSLCEPGPLPPAPFDAAAAAAARCAPCPPVFVPSGIPDYAARLYS